jgi:hypothetical protein
MTAGVRHHLTADAWSQLLFMACSAACSSGLCGERSVPRPDRLPFCLSHDRWGVMEARLIFARARISMEKVRALGPPLARGRREANERPTALPWGPRADGVTFAYPADGDGQASRWGRPTCPARRAVSTVGERSKSTFKGSLGLSSPARHDS